MNVKMAFRLFAGVAMASALCEAGPTLLLAGDSTLDDYGRKPRPPYASWGTELEKSMKPGCKVDNYAKSGASTKSFIEAGHWARLIAAVKPGDYVGIFITIKRNIEHINIDISAVLLNIRFISIFIINGIL